MHLQCTKAFSVLIKITSIALMDRTTQSMQQLKFRKNYVYEFEAVHALNKNSQVTRHVFLVPQSEISLEI